MINIGHIYKQKVKVAAVLFTLSVSLFAITSCSDYLDTPSQSSLTTENFYKSPADMDQALTGIYSCLKPVSKYYFVMSELRSDNMFEIKEAKIYDEADCAQFNASSLLNNSLVASCWKDYYKLIAAANVYLDRIDNVSFETQSMKTEYIAQARFLRGMAYFDLVRFFGRVPVSTHELQPNESFNLRQSESIDTYNDVIIPDLKYAAENLPDVCTDYQGKTHTERVTRNAAHALLGRVYMQMAGYPLYQDTKEMAAKELRTVLESVGALSGKPQKYWASSMDEWNRMWIHENDNKYFIFEIQYACEADQGNPMTPLSKTSNSKDEFCNANLTTGHHFYVDRDLQDHFFEKGMDEDGIETVTITDQRMAGTINLAQTYDEESGTYIGGARDQDNFMIKFFEHKIKRSNLGYTNMDDQILKYTYWPQNYPLVRLEDVMLLYAECVGNTDEGYHLLNMIHTRAGLEAFDGLSAEDFQEAVKQERRYELLGEGQRWFDEVRQNTFVNDKKTAFLNYRDKRSPADPEDYTVFASRVLQTSYLYPIPLSQIQVRDGLYQQNEGY